MDACRLIIDPPQRGTWNMAVDEALLAAAADGGPATLRFYEWSEPTLSLGYFQRLADRQLHVASRECAVVRRQSGGGAILHDHELTYSLVLPGSHRLARNATALYTAMHQAFIEVLTRQLAGASGESWSLELNGKPAAVRREEPFLCFERRACGDLLLRRHQEPPATNPAPQAYKILGSAQRRHRGAILQHGSFLIAQSAAAPELPGWSDLTSGAMPVKRLTSDLVRQISRVFDWTLEPSELPAAICDEAREIERDRYSSRSWTARR